MNEARGLLTHEQREEILRNIWTLHDGRWFIKTIEKSGLDTANELNQTVIRSMGKTEIKLLLRETAIGKISDVEELKTLISAASNLYFPREHKYEFKVLNENELVGHVIDCYVHKSVEKAGFTEHYQCAARPRFESWIEAMDLKGEILQNKTTLDCNGSCKITFRIDEWRLIENRLKMG